MANVHDYTLNSYNNFEKIQGKIIGKLHGPPVTLKLPSQGPQDHLPPPP